MYGYDTYIPRKDIEWKATILWLSLRQVLHCCHNFLRTNVLFEIFLAIQEVWSRFYLVDRLEMYSMVVMGDITWDQNGSKASQLECEGSTATRWAAQMLNAEQASLSATAVPVHRAPSKSMSFHCSLQIKTLHNKQSNATTCRCSGHDPAPLCAPAQSKQCWLA